MELLENKALSYLFEHHNNFKLVELRQDWYFEASYFNLARHLNVDLRTIRELIASLYQKGLIECKSFISSKLYFYFTESAIKQLKQ